MDPPDAHAAAAVTAHGQRLLDDASAKRDYARARACGETHAPCGQGDVAQRAPEHPVCRAIALDVRRSPSTTATPRRERRRVRGLIKADAAAASKAVGHSPLCLLSAPRPPRFSGLSAPQPAPHQTRGCGLRRWLAFAASSAAQRSAASGSGAAFLSPAGLPPPSSAAVGVRPGAVVGTRTGAAPNVAAQYAATRCARALRRRCSACGAACAGAAAGPPPAPGPARPGVRPSARPKKIGGRAPGRRKAETEGELGAGALPGKPPQKLAFPRVQNPSKKP